MMTAWPEILPLVFPKRYSHFGSDYDRTLHTLISWNAPDIHTRWRDPKVTQWMVPRYQTGGSVCVGGGINKIIQVV